jgi:hypothetical protein
VMGVVFHVVVMLAHGVEGGWLCCTDMAILQGGLVSLMVSHCCLVYLKGSPSFSLESIVVTSFPNIPHEK